MENKAKACLASTYPADYAEYYEESRDRSLVLVISVCLFITRLY